MNNMLFIENLLLELCADERIVGGIFDIHNTQHLAILSEYLSSRCGSDFSKCMMENIRHLETEGNYPERQAYNEDGTLVTFPDAESKKAAIKRGSHFENPPGGKKEDDVTPSSEEDSDEDIPDMFVSADTPEKRQSDKNVFLPGTDINPEDVKLSDREDRKDAGRHHLYDILQSLRSFELGKNEKMADYTLDDETTFTLDKLHPSVLFALAEKWVFDRSGDWYDEVGKYKGNTDLRGQVHPSKVEDKEKMELWIEDYLKRPKIKKSSY